MMSFTMNHQQFAIAQISVTLSANILGGTISLQTGIVVSFQITFSFESRVASLTLKA